MAELMPQVVTPPDHVVPPQEIPPALPRRPFRSAGSVVRFLLRRPGLLLSILLLVGVLVAVLAPGLFTSADPLTGVRTENLQPPSAEHWFGTDQVGRDLYTRIVHGAGLSLKAAIVAVLIALFVGSLLGLVSGFIGSWVDSLIMRVMDALLAIPALLLALAVISVLGFGTTNVAVAVGAVGIASFARVMRAEVLRVRNMPYVEAARSSGVRWPGVLFRHVLPNARGPVLVLSTLEFGTALLAISALSFLGFGTPPPSPEWGALIADGRQYLAVAWWLATFPGLAIAAVVLAVNRISRTLDVQRSRG
jgi:peptide/nickel transport system permease protein